MDPSMAPAPMDLAPTVLVWSAHRPDHPQYHPRHHRHRLRLLGHRPLPHRLQDQQADHLLDHRRGPSAATAACARVRGYSRPMRYTDFWERMELHLGTAYARSYARDQVLSQLSGRTVEQALAEGEDATVVWRAVVAALELPARYR